MQELVNSLVEGFVDAFLQDPIVKAFIESKQLSRNELIEAILSSPYVDNTITTQVVAKESFVMSTNYAKSMLSAEFDSGFIGDGSHCIHCYGNRTITEHPPHTYCAKECGSLYCKEHYKPELNKITKAYNEKKYNLEAHKEKRDALRKTNARNYLKQEGYNSKDLKIMNSKRRIQYREYPHDKKCFYNSETGVVVKQIIGDFLREYRTVGVDKRCNGKMRKLEIDDVSALSGTTVVFGHDSLSKEALEFLEVED